MLVALFPHSRDAFQRRQLQAALVARVRLLPSPLIPNTLYLLNSGFGGISLLFFCWNCCYYCCYCFGCGIVAFDWLLLFDDIFLRGLLCREFDSCPFWIDLFFCAKLLLRCFYAMLPNHPYRHVRLDQARREEVVLLQLRLLLRLLPLVLLLLLLHELRLLPLHPAQLLEPLPSLLTLIEHSLHYRHHQSLPVPHQQLEGLVDLRPDPDLVVVEFHSQVVQQFGQLIPNQAHLPYESPLIYLIILEDQRVHEVVVHEKVLRKVLAGLDAEVDVNLPQLVVLAVVKLLLQELHDVVPLVGRIALRQYSIILITFRKSKR